MVDFGSILQARFCSTPCRRRACGNTYIRTTCQPQREHLVSALGNCVVALVFVEIELSQTIASQEIGGLVEIEHVRVIWAHWTVGTIQTSATIAKNVCVLYAARLAAA